MGTPFKIGLTDKRYEGEECEFGHGRIRYIASRTCIECQRERLRKWQQKNRKPARQKQSYAEKLKKRVAYNKAWRARNPDKASAHGKRWRQSNHGKVLARVRKRQALLAQRLPKWADLEKIKAIYNLAALMNKSELNTKYHVDHIIPLRGKDVCGLHVESNLQVIPARLNLSKGNRRWVQEEGASQRWTLGEFRSGEAWKHLSP